MTYVFGPEWERKRLAGIEAAADLISSDVLSRLGVGPGWRSAVGSRVEYLNGGAAHSGHPSVADGTAPIM